METLKSFSWYYGNIERAKAEKILQMQPADKDYFLIREKAPEIPENIKIKNVNCNVYGLSVRFVKDSSVRHYIIYYCNPGLHNPVIDKTGFYIDTKVNHISGYDYFGNASDLEKNLANGEVSLSTNDTSTHIAVHCFP